LPTRSHVADQLSNVVPQQPDARSTTDVHQALRSGEGEEVNEHSSRELFAISALPYW
jgi:hypothetical protein